MRLYAQALRAVNADAAVAAFIDLSRGKKQGN
jgi:hypothetical protein